MGIRETRMMANALQQRWPIEPKYREAIVRRLMQVIASKDSSAREATVAAKALMSAEAQNQQDEHKVIDVRIQQRRAELSGIAAELGIDPRLIEDAGTEAGGGTEADV